MTAKTYTHVVIVGPTASGKSDLAMGLARALGGEIISCDSVQIYRKFDIGSAKPTPDERKLIPHHLIDIRDWNQPYDAKAYASDAWSAICAVAERGGLPIVVGGTGLYLRALWGDRFQEFAPKDEALREELSLLSSEEIMIRLAKLDPKRASEIHLNDRYRLARALEIAILGGGPMHSSILGPDLRGALTIWLNPQRSLLHNRIARRTNRMLDLGLTDEVSTLRAEGIKDDAKPMQSIGYKQSLEFCDGLLTRSQLFEKIAAATRQYAKRQCTWFKQWEYDLVLTDDVDQGHVADFVARRVLGK